MKTIFLFSTAALGVIAPLSAQTGSYNTIIRQIQKSTSVVWDMPLTGVAGNTLAPMALDNGGALFQLYTGKPTEVPIMLADKTVGVYLPEASVKIITPDPYPTEVCTRADVGFTTQITVANLLSGAGIPDAETKVLLQRYAKAYPASGTLTVSQATDGTPVNSSYLATNGVSSTHYAVSGLDLDVGKAYGEEHFVVHALAVGNIAQAQIATGYVRIFPTASGTILGISEGQKIGMKAPNLTMPLKNLYPRSTTWLRIYPGAWESGKVGEVVNVPLTREGNNPYSDTLAISDWEQAMTEDGPYTIELVTQTAFDAKPISLSKVSFVLDRTIKVQATLVDMN